VEIAALVTEAARFAERMRALKASLGDPGFEWYPYDTMSAVGHLEKLLTGDNRNLLDGRGRVLDMGSQDGELGFFLESLGYQVVAADHPAYNHNGMRGIRALKTALHSSVGSSPLRVSPLRVSPLRVSGVDDTTLDPSSDAGTAGTEPQPDVPVQPPAGSTVLGVSANRGDAGESLAYTVPDGVLKGLEVGAYYTGNDSDSKFWTDVTGYDTAKDRGVVYVKKTF